MTHEVGFLFFREDMVVLFCHVRNITGSGLNKQDQGELRMIQSVSDTVLINDAGLRSQMNNKQQSFTAYRGQE